MDSIRHWISRVMAESVHLQIPRPSPDPILAMHLDRVRDEVRQLKHDGMIIQMTQQAKPFEDGQGRGYQTVLWYGVTHAPMAAAFIRTYQDGTNSVQRRGLEE